MSLSWPLLWKCRKASQQWEGGQTWLGAKIEIESVTERLMWSPVTTGL